MVNSATKSHDRPSGTESKTSTTSSSLSSSSTAAGPKEKKTKKVKRNSVAPTTTTTTTKKNKSKRTTSENAATSTKVAAKAKLAKDVSSKTEKNAISKQSTSNKKSKNSTTKKSAPSQKTNQEPDIQLQARPSRLGRKHKIQPDGDTWVEKLAVAESLDNATGGAMKLVVRSYYKNTTTGQRTWDEPPSGASRIAPASAEMRRMAELQVQEMHVVGVPSSGRQIADDDSDASSSWSMASTVSGGSSSRSNRSRRSNVSTKSSSSSSKSKTKNKVKFFGSTSGVNQSSPIPRRKHSRRTKPIIEYKPGSKLIALKAKHDALTKDAVEREMLAQQYRQELLRSAQSSSRSRSRSQPQSQKEKPKMWYEKMDSCYNYLLCCGA